MTTPSVAVVIPSFNHGRYIEETLRSVFRQTLPPRAVHVVDDGSTDDSVAAIERAFASAGSIPCSLTVRENRGISSTRNELWRRATADFVAFLDSDDLYAPTRLERMLACAPADRLYFAFSGVDFLFEEGGESLDDWHETYLWKLGQGRSLPTAGFALLRSNVAISASNFVVSRQLLEKVGGFDDRIKICQDWDFAVQALRYVEPTFIPEPLLTYRVHPKNTSRNAARTAAWEVDVVADKFCRWILQSTPNPIAPTARNWPRYFRVFARLNASPAGRALAGLVPAEILAKSSEAAPASARETKAIRDLITLARLPETFLDLSRNDLMMRCQETWTVSP